MLSTSISLGSSKSFLFFYLFIFFGAVTHFDRPSTKSFNILNSPQI